MLLLRLPRLQACRRLPRWCRGAAGAAQPRCAGVGRATLDDVERIARGDAARRRGTGSRAVPHRLDETERVAWDLAKAAGYLTLTGSGNRRERKGSPLANSWRQRCDALAHPAVVLHRGAPDRVVVDASPLRCPAGGAALGAARAACLAAAAAHAGASMVPGAMPAGADGWSSGGDAAPASDEEESGEGADAATAVDGDALQGSLAIWALPSRTMEWECASREEAKALAVALAAALGVRGAPAVAGGGARGRRRGGAGAATEDDAAAAVA